MPGTVNTSHSSAVRLGEVRRKDSFSSFSLEKNTSTSGTPHFRTTANTATLPRTEPSRHSTVPHTAPKA